jgi:hypothetical protein
MKPGDIEYDEEQNILSLVTVGNDSRDAVIRAEEFIRGYFGDESLFVGKVQETTKVGSIAAGDLFKVVCW